MNDLNRFSLTLQSLAKLASKSDQARSAPLSALPSLNSVLTEFAPLPHTALFLGLATDGLPILLNLLDPLPGPIMIVGDKGCGKTNFLRTILSSAARVHSSHDLSYSIISRNTSEWKTIQNISHSVNLLSPSEPNILSYLRSLVEWAHSNKGEQQISLLFIDRIETLLEIPAAQQDLRWLLLRGPSRHVWPIVTVQTSTAVSGAFQPWLEAFRTRLFGYVHDDHKAQLLTGLAKISFANLISGFQFVMREGDNWLPFWIPTLD